MNIVASGAKAAGRAEGMGGGTFVGAKRQTRAIMGIAIVVGAEKVMTK